MANLERTTRQRGARLAGILFCLLIILPPVAHGQAGGSRELAGIASVVIFDDFDAGYSELRYYLVDQATHRETRLFFTADQAPDGFETGRRFRVVGRDRPGGLQVDSVAPLDGDGGGAGAPESGSAPVASPETRNVLTLLVDFNDANVDGFKADGVTPMKYGISLQEAKDRMYNQAKSVAGLFYNASLGTLTIPDDPDNDGVQDVFGPYQIDDSYIGGDSSQCSPSTWVNLASAAWEAANPGKDISLYRHRLLIVPNYWDWSNRHCGWGGVAQVGCGTWCWAIGADGDTIFHGVLIHELGHNLGFNHAQTDTDNNGSTNVAYGDGSDMMGVSRSWMKFNAPHAEDKGWIDPVDYEIRTITPSASPQTFDLIAIDEEVWDWPGLRAIKVQRTANTDYYVSWRKKAGDYNNVNTSMTYGGATNYFADRLNIHYGYDNSTYTYFVTSLQAGETFSEPHNNLLIKATSTVIITDPVTSDTTEVMGVEICQNACSTITAPSDLTATPVSKSAIDLAWQDNSENEDSFRLEHSGDGSAWSTLAETALTAYTHGGLATASTHYYRVLAYNSEDESGYSNTASATTFAEPPVSNFSWSADYTEVTFTDLSSDPDGNITNWSWDFDDGGGSSAQHPVHTFASAGEYMVELTVTDNHGATGWSSQAVSVSAPPFEDFYAESETAEGGSVSGSYLDTHADDGDPQAITERESSGKPANRHSWLGHRWTFNIGTGALATVYVNAWQSASSDGDNFEFAWSTDGENWTTALTVTETADGSPLSFSLPDGVGGVVYLRVTDTDQSVGHRALDTVYVDQLRIRVENGSVEPPDGAPSGLAATADGHERVDLEWTDGSGNETGFRVLRRVGSSGEFAEVGQAAAAPGSGSVVTHTDTNGLVADTTYEYQVVAYTAGGDSTPAGPAAATTGPEPGGSISLSANGYKIKGVHTADLAWSGQGGKVDVWRGSSLIAGGFDGSSLTDDTGNKGSASYVYKVCEEGTADCSNEATVTF